MRKNDGYEQAAIALALVLWLGLLWLVYVVQYVD